MKYITHTTTAIALLSLMTLGSCERANDPTSAKGTSQVSFKMIDAPGDYQEVLVDIKEVNIKVDSNWVNVPTTGGVYNLLDYVAGKDTLLSAGTVPSGNIGQIRLVLGDSNFVMVDSVYHALNTPSGQQSGLKLKANFTLVPNVDYSFYLDFDAAKSIVKTGNGKYNLKPVLYLIADAQSGSIDGYALPDSVTHHLSAISTTTNDTVTNTYTDTTGYFLLMGLPQDVYDIYVHPGSGFAGQTLPGVNVTNGTTTFADTINL